MKKSMLLAAIVAATSLFSLAGCVSQPFDEYFGGPSQGPIYQFGTESHFEGWASKGNSTVIIEIQNQVTFEWLEVKRTTSNGAGFNFGGEELHFWERDFVLSSTPGITKCHFSPSCTGYTGWATFRVREPAGKSKTLVTHRRGGYERTVAGVQDGLSLVDAYLASDPPDAYTELRVYIHN